MPRKNVSVAKNDLHHIPTPAATETWLPTPHHTVVDVIDNELEDRGIGVRSEVFTLNAKGTQMFASYALDVSIGTGAQLHMGFRNAHDKQFALGLTGGVHVMVCSNLQFSGEFVDLRKHTTGLTMEVLVKFIAAAVDKIQHKSQGQWEWQQSLRQIDMVEDDLKTFAYDCMDQGAFAPSQFFAYKESLEEEIKISDGVTLQQAHGAVTRLHRKSSPPTIARISPVLRKVCDDTWTNKLALI